ncbi:MAG: HNH endonuclease [Flavobacteriaceae bacterium]|nr:HNH endonuclease [Flavobacteriaceae bacterium]
MSDLYTIERPFNKRYRFVTVEDVQKFINNGYYVVLKCEIEISKPKYPYRESEVREYHWRGSPPKKLEFPIKSKEELVYPTGRFTTWLRTKELAEALSDNCIIKCHDVLVSKPAPNHRKIWRKLTKELFEKYGNICMRCGDVISPLQVDHIEPWSQNPSLRYDINNLQILCIHCHKWKTRQKKSLDFRGVLVNGNESDCNKLAKGLRDE